MSFDSQKKIISQKNPIDFIEEYVLGDDIVKFRFSSNEITVSSKGVWKNYDILFRWDNKKKLLR